MDESPTGELDSVPTKDFAAVNDGCTLCDMCFTAKCPYTPPHELNIDFPHLILRYRAIENATGNQAAAAALNGGLETGPWLDNSHSNAKAAETAAGVSRTLHKSPASAAHRLIANQNVTGPLGSRLAPLANAATQSPGSTARKAMEAVTHFDANAPLPPFSSETFLSWFAKQPRDSDGESTATRKVVLYATCFVNHNRPAIGKAAVALLRASGVHVEAVFPGW